MVLVQNILASFCCVLGKNTLRHFFLLGGLEKKFYITIISLLDFKCTTISLSPEAGWGNCLSYVLAPMLDFPASQEDKHRDKTKNKFGQSQKFLSSDRKYLEQKFF